MSVVVSEAIRPVLVTRCVTLRKGEVFRLPTSCRAVWVVSGRAWLTHSGKDIVLDKGERMTFARHKDPVVVAPTGTMPLILEIAGR
jgi:hypothetical protein